MHRLIARIVAAAVLAPAAVLVASASPAAAEFCGTGGGVSTVVDFGSLGGGVRRECGSGPDAAAAFGSDHTLEQHPRQAGFVCRIDGAPASGDCLKTDAYWGLFVSDDGGPWVYASAGAYGQPVDDGDAVAFVWQSSATRRSPGVAPPAAPSAQPTKQPTKKPTKKPSKQPTKQSTQQPAKAATNAPTRNPTPQPSAPGAPAETAASSATPSASDPATPSATPSGSATPTTADGASATAGAVSAPTDATTASPTEISEPETVPAAEQTTEDDGVPTWLVLAMLVAVLGATGAVLVHRRRSAGSSGP